MKGKWLIAGALILAEIGICGAIITAVWAGVNVAKLSRFEFVNDRVSVTADEEDRLTVSGPVTINVNKGDLPAYGNITVIGGSGDEIVVTAHKIAWAADTASAQADLDQLNVIVTQTGSVIDVRVDRPNPIGTIGTHRPDTVDFTLTVPVEASVYLVSDFGDISAKGLEGSVHIDTDFGSAVVTNVTGGGVDIRSGFGEIKLREVVADDISARSNLGELTLENVKATGSITLNTDFGLIRFTGGAAKSLNAQTNGGEVQLESLQVKESVEAGSDFGDVRVTKVAAASYDLHSNGGVLTLQGASGLVQMRTDFGDVIVTEAADVTLDLKTNSGTIEFAGTLGQGPHSIQTDFGTVRLQLPETSELTFDLKTDFGRIKSDLPITLTGDQENNHWVGEINGGGAQLNAKTNGGDITIETLNP